MKFAIFFGWVFSGINIQAASSEDAADPKPTASGSATTAATILQGSFATIGSKSKMNPDLTQIPMFMGFLPEESAEDGMS